MAILDSQFWNKLTKISQSVGMSPNDLLAVMYYESGLNPAAHNKNGDASGLIQFMPETLKGMGYTDKSGNGDHSNFRQLNALDQLDYVAQYVHSKAKFNGGGFKSATQYYVANLWPIALRLPGVQQENPNTVILEQNPTTQKYPEVSRKQEQEAYNANAGLDTNHDGKITYGDLDKVMQGVKKSAGYQNAVEKLSNGDNVAVGNDAPSKSSPVIPPTGLEKEESDKLAKIEMMLGKMQQAFAAKNNKQMVKKAYSKLLPNLLLIKISSSELDTSIEFARILQAALDEEIMTESLIHFEDNQVEVSCTIHGSKELSSQAVLQLCQALSEMFEEATIKIGSKQVFCQLIPNQSSQYKLASNSLMQACYNNFHSQFIKGFPNG